jgi:hypothetical protein
MKAGQGQRHGGRGELASSRSDRARAQRGRSLFETQCHLGPQVVVAFSFLLQCGCGGRVCLSEFVSVARGMHAIRGLLSSR